MAAELRQFIQQGDPVVRQRRFARHLHVAAIDQPHIRDGVMRGTKRARGDDGGPAAGEAGDVVVLRACLA
jgi:hypothetical protein